MLGRLQQRFGPLRDHPSTRGRVSVLPVVEQSTSRGLTAFWKPRNEGGAGRGVGRYGNPFVAAAARFTEGRDAYLALVRPRGLISSDKPPNPPDHLRSSAVLHG